MRREKRRIGERRRSVEVCMIDTKMVRGAGAVVVSSTPIRKGRVSSVSPQIYRRRDTESNVITVKENRLKDR